MSLRTVSPLEAKRLVDEGAILVDIREATEYARENIPGARHIPLSTLEQADFAAHRGRIVLFHCRSGARTKGYSARLAAKTHGLCEALVVEGGIDAWRRAGLFTSATRR